MADPLSITASVIAVATLAYQSLKSLSNTISALKHAPENLKDLRNDLDILQSLLDSLQKELGSTKSVNQTQSLTFGRLKPALDDCKAACDGFNAKLIRLTSHSGTDHVNWFDRLRLQFKEDDILLFKAKLANCKQTLDIALGVATISTIGQNQSKLQDLETQIATSVSSFTGQICGLETAVRSLSLAPSNVNQIDMASIIAILDDHDRMLKQYVSFCTSALTEVNERTGNSVKYARTFDEARQFIGNMGDVGRGGPATNVEQGEARDRSRQVIGNMSGDVARDFLS
ncbi:uncharacterized protein F4807DRAFT_413235 [Annulohypoxylon truncatum]|uniref:uncharacterized protein n=1 Tax=Annulohypoxylon truncatum TaxID=327061 RepID=UPI0020087EB1|nr:uncharacterized protein F4807DRAFT_413235 [Annulohypoxylon truncatum]KAI1213193.1 hypothetical protein F4807DRAFT_413235 [Annulohypoxylon truncatum]